MTKSISQRAVGRTKDSEILALVMLLSVAPIQCSVCGTGNCDGSAACINTIGSVTCGCSAGYAATEETCAIPFLLDCASVCTATQFKGTNDEASRAFDGRGLDGQWNSNGCISAGQSSAVHSWWQVDLGELRSLSHLKVCICI